MYDNGSEESKAVLKEIEDFYKSPEGLASITRDKEILRNERLPYLRKFLRKWKTLFPNIELDVEEGYYVIDGFRFDNHFTDIHKIEPFYLREKLPAHNNRHRVNGILIENMEDLNNLKNNDPHRL
jgi:hypothetical protein